MEIKTEDYTVEYSDSEETKQKVFDTVINFFKEHKSFCGECIAQSDAPQIASTEFLCTLADDVICFKQTFNDE